MPLRGGTARAIARPDTATGCRGRLPRIGA